MDLLDSIDEEIFFRLLLRWPGLWLLTLVRLFRSNPDPPSTLACLVASLVVWAGVIGGVWLALGFPGS
ncbi:MAG: hypothetical protein AAF682_09220 [Planctomycetota bacterium]